MIDPKNFDDLTKRFVEALPPSVRQFQAEMEKNLHAALQATFAKLDLVTREEFEVQQGVLARTRAKLEELEKQVAELKARRAAASGARRPTKPPNRKAANSPAPNRCKTAGLAKKLRPLTPGSSTGWGSQ